jgi:3,4-dihydroxy 2-butanone 4-phosphate synthase/GTP cyclohydrolase II
MTDRFSTIQAAVEAIAAGKVVIVLDDEDRENEGDFVCAADRITPELVNFMLAGHGQLCCSILPAAAQRLDLRPMVETNTSPLSTAFLTPVDFAGCKTGITAAERSETIRRLASETTVSNDFVKPGHVFPLLAMEGGVLRRAGHTEASMDLARMAGLTPAGVLCEILNSTGDRATRDELLEIARQHSLEIITVEQLIAHRRVNEKLVTRSAQCKLPTRFGEFRVVVYGVQYESQEPIALAFGDLEADLENPPLVRMHSSCFTGDLISSLRCDCGDQLHLALEAISKEKRGVLSICLRRDAASDWRRRSRPMRFKTRGSIRSKPTTAWVSNPTCAITASGFRSSRTSV